MTSSHPPVLAAMRRICSSTALSMMLVAALAQPAAAHFLWLAAEREEGKPVVRAFLSETPTPDSADLLKHIENSKITADGKPLTWTKDEDTFVVKLPTTGGDIINGFCDLGLMTRGDATFRLLYTGRAQFGPANSPEPADSEHLRVRLVRADQKAPIVAVTFNGKPAAGAVVKAFTESGNPIETKTDERGQVACPGVAEGKTALLVKWITKQAGEFEGKRFSEIRYYATLTVAPVAIAVAAASAAAPGASAPFAVLPEAVNSFGGAVAGEWLYVYSGHVGETHKYHRDTTTKRFGRLNLKDRTRWEELRGGPAVQGVTLVAWDGKLYRVGGMAAHNGPNEADDLRSIADFARFDPATKTWTNLPSLPEPRSTHDAVVAGDKLYVIGGWSMTGGAASSADFCDTALVFDLRNPKGPWETLPAPPFHRRALAVAELGGKIYVLGGLTEDGPPTNAVDVFDIAHQTWSKGPELAGGRMQGFAPSAFGVEGKLYVSGYDGVVYRLNSTGDGWERHAKLAMPRVTHRLLPGIAGDLLAVAGTFGTMPVRLVESVSLTERALGPKAVTWTVPVPTHARQGQAVSLYRSKMMVAGGNRSSEPHAFEAENLVPEAALVTLGAMRADALPSLPVARQSSVIAVGRVDQRDTAFLLGGIGPDGEITRTLGDVFRLDTEKKAWTKLSASIPDNRGMFCAAVHNDTIWLFGGNTWDPRVSKDTSKPTTTVLRWNFTKTDSTFEPTGQTIPRARRSFAGAVLGGKYYLVGGLGDDQKVVDTVDVFEFESSRWSTIPAPRHPRLFAELVAMDGKLYLVGGYQASEVDHFAPANSIEVFDPQAGDWSELLSALPVPPQNIYAAPIQGRLLLYAPDRSGSEKAQFALVAP
jgi:N-acetylneuraminic acid mutarotase